MLPGKKYVPEDFLMMAWKRKWLLIIPTVVASVGTFFYARQLPDVYRGDTTILVVPQRVPTDYVRPTVTTRLDERLNSIQQQIMTRTRLENLIRELDLYKAERAAGEIMEDVVERMRRDINVRNAGNRRNTDAFTVSYMSTNRRAAADVASKLASQFVAENITERTSQADATSRYLETEMNSARNRMLDVERQLQEYKQRYAGQLPTQVESNLSMMTQTQSRLTTLGNDMARDRDRILQLESEAASLNVGLAVAPPPPPSFDSGMKGATAAQQLAATQEELKRQLQRYGPEWPSVVQLKSLIADLEKKAEAEALSRPVSIAAGTRALTPAEERLQAIQKDLQQLRQGLEQKQITEGQLQERLKFYSARLEAIPGREAELVDLMRDYPIVQQAYHTLARQSEEAKRAVNLERVSGGEQFKVLEGARLPERPISPDRPRMNLIGAAAGLGFGVLLVALLEYRDTTIKTDTDVASTLALPVLAVIPVMLTDGDRLRAKRRRKFAMAAAGAVVVLAVAAVVEWQFDIVRNLVR